MVCMITTIKCPMCLTETDRLEFWRKIEIVPGESEECIYVHICEECIAKPELITEGDIIRAAYFTGFSNGLTAARDAVDEVPKHVV